MAPEQNNAHQISTGCGAKSRAVIPPAVRRGRKVDALDRVLDVCGKDANRIQRQHDAGQAAHPCAEECQGSGYFADPRGEHDLGGEKEPSPARSGRRCRAP